MSEEGHKNEDALTKDDLIRLLKKCQKEILALPELEKQLQELRRHYDSLSDSFKEILERIPVAAYSTTAGEDAQALYLSGRFGDWTGFKSDDALTLEQFFSSIHPDDVERVSNEFAEIYRTKRAYYKLEYRVVNHKTKEVRYVRDMASYSEGDAGGKYDGVMLDITNEVELQSQTEEKTRELQRMVKLMTGRERKMIELKKELEGLKEVLKNKDTGE